MRTVAQRLILLLRTVFPQNLVEISVFFLFFVSYALFGGYIALHYTIIFDDRIPWDAYFSFDNRAIVLTGGGFERHPLSNYFFDAIRDFALWISGNKKDEIFRLILALCSAFTISLANVQIFKYLKNIIRLPQFIALFLSIFSGILVTPILLSFTPETYTYSFLFLILFNYYTALKLRNNTPLSGIALTFFGIGIGGMTITNIVKVYLPIFFEKGLFRSWKKWGNAVLRVLISLAVFLFLFLYRIDFKYQNLLTKTQEQYEKFTKVKTIPVWDMIYSWFFGGNLLFSNFEIRNYHNANKTFYYKALFMEVYSSWMLYLFVGIIFLLVFWSYLRNFKNKLVQILMLSFFFDIFIHCILKFGLRNAYIYGGHFVFIIPLMLGWLLYSYRNSPKMLSAIFSILGITFVFSAMNNLIRLEEFIHFLGLYYQ